METNPGGGRAAPRCTVTKRAGGPGALGSRAISGVGRAPVRQHAGQAARGQISRDLILVQVAEPEPGQARLQHQGLVVDDKPSIRKGLLCPTALPEFPEIQGFAALQAIADAAMPDEISG